MPPVIPFIPLIAAAATIGSQVGLTLSNQPDSPKQQTPVQIAQNAVQQETQRRQGQAQNAAQLLPNLQYDTSGGLSPDAYSQLSATFSGNPDIANSSQLQQLVAQFLGTGGGFGGSSGFASGGLTPG